MRYLTQRSSGIWYFRYQIPPKFRSQFSDRCEFKKSLHTRCRKVARLKASIIEQELWQEMLLVEQQSNEKTLSIELLPKFFKLEERNVWGFSDSEKEKLVDKLSSFLSKIETQPQLLRAQKRRIALRNDSAEEWIESIELIENLWDRTKSSVDQAKAIVSDLPWAKILKNHITMMSLSMWLSHCVNFLNLSSRALMYSM